MSTINDMRRYISNKYPGMDWKVKVSKMKTAQVIAVYHAIKEREQREAIIVDNRETPGYHQIDMFEYLYSINNGKETHTEVNV